MTTVVSISRIYDGDRNDQDPDSKGDKLLVGYFFLTDGEFGELTFRITDLESGR